MAEITPQPLEKEQKQSPVGEQKQLLNSRIKQRKLKLIIAVFISIFLSGFFVWGIYHWLPEGNFFNNVFLDDKRPTYISSSLFTLAISLPVVYILWQFRTEDTHTNELLQQRNLQITNVFKAIDLCHSGELKQRLQGIKQVALLINLFPWTTDTDKEYYQTLLDSATKGIQLPEADLSFINLKGANLSQANLSQSNLSEAKLSGANLSQANLSGTNLSKADLSRADLSRADLSGAYSEVDLSEVDREMRAELSGADISRANLSEADLSGADLSGANLGRAYLREVNPSEADLREVNPSEADLSEMDAFLNEVNIREVDLRGAIANGQTQFPAGFAAEEQGVIFEQ